MSKRRGGATLNITPAEAIDLENRAKGKLNQVMSWNVSTYVPVVAWFLWILAGTLFYTYHDDLTLAKGFYHSVNVGWSIAWDINSTSCTKGTASKLYSVFHATMGVVFLGVIVMFIAKKIAEGSGKWLDSESYGSDAEQVSPWLSVKHSDEESGSVSFSQLLLSYIPTLQRHHRMFIKHVVTFRLIYLFLLWIVMGVVWAAVAVKRWSEGMVFDFVLSTLTGAGYVNIPQDSKDSAYVFVAVYAAFGVPITAVAIGIFLSLLFAAPETGHIVQKIVAEVTPEEVDFLQHTGIETDDGLLDHQSFLILAAIRMGTASSELIVEIIDRFTMLDRKRENRIAYDDLVVGSSTKYKQKRSIRNLTKSRKFQELKASLRLSRPPDKGSHELREQDTLGLSLPMAVKMTSKLIRLKKNSRIHSFPYRGTDAVDECVGRIASHNTTTLHDDTSRRSSADPAPRLSSFAVRQNGVTDVGLFVHPIRMLRVRRERLGVVQPSRVAVAGNDGGIYADVITPREAKKNEDMESLTRCATEQGPFAYSALTGLESFEEVYSHEFDETARKKSNHDGGDCPQVRKAWHNSPSSSTEIDHPPEKTLSCTGETEQFPDQIIPPPPAPLHSVPSLIHHLIKHSRLKKKYQMKKQEAVRLGRTRLPTTTLAWIVYLARVVSHDSGMRFFSAWFFWILGGYVFFRVYEGHSFQEAIYRSVSFGYGLFWVSQEDSVWSKLFVRVHLILGIFAINLVRALFAKKMTETDAQWYHDVKVRAEMDEIFSNALATTTDKIIAWKKYYIPKLRIYILFALWVTGGIMFGVFSMHWNIVDSLFFSVSVMATGTFLPVDSSNRGDASRHMFVALYIIVGVPLMTVCMSHLANAITGFGGAQIVQNTLSANITAKELDMMQSFGIVDGNGYINRKEYTILVLVRMGVLLPSMIKSINSVFVSMDNGAIHSMNSADLASLLTADAKNGDDLLNELRSEVARATKVSTGSTFKRRR